MTRTLIGLTTCALLLGSLCPATAAPQTPPEIGLSGLFASDRVQRGRTVQAAIVMDIPHGYHVNSNRPLSSFARPTVIRIEAPKSVTASAVTYPRAVVRSFKFSKDKLSVFEGRAIMRFRVTVPAGYTGASVDLKVKVSYQACDDEVCFPPATRDIRASIPVAGANEAVRSVNGDVFGRK